MSVSKPREDVTLLDVLIDGFEKNEVLHGFHERVLPMPSEAMAHSKFLSFVAEATRWKGEPLQRSDDEKRHLAAWSDMEIRHEARGVAVLVRPPRFQGWWYDDEVWENDPLNGIYEWLANDAKAAPKP